MKLCKNIVCLLLCIAVVCGICACGGGSGAQNGEATTLVVYRARSNGMTVGVDDEKVEKALEDKFYEDTGLKIDLKMQMYENEELPQKVDTGFPSKKVQIDAVLHTISNDDVGSAIMKYARSTDEPVSDVDSLLEQYGQNILKYIRMNDEGHLAERAGYVSINGNIKMKIIPAVYETKTFAIMLRKDYWEKAYKSKKTSLNPEDYDVTNSDYKNLTVEEFASVMKAIGETVTTVSYPVTGKFWDLCRTIGSAYGADYFNAGTDTDGTIIPQMVTEGYAKFMDLLYDWSKNGIWEIDSAQVNDDTRKSNFIAGKNAAYVSYPTPSELINVSRSLSNVDSSAQCMIIAPLAVEENGSKIVRGYYQQPAAFEGIVLPAKSGNSELMVKFLDWMYASVDNYELAKYGIKGEHWIDGPTVEVEGKTYQTWAYPAGKEDAYNKSSPYSGCWNILINTNLSNRIRADYNTTEKNWCVYITQIFEGYCNFETVGINIAEAPRDYYTATAKISADFTEINAKAITGQLYNGKTPGTAINELRENILEKYAGYIAWLNESYTASKTFFATKFGD